MKRKVVTSLSVGLSLAIILALFAAFAPVNVQRVNADPGTMEWTEINTPSTEDWVIAPNSDILDLAVGPDGDTIYTIGTMFDPIECDYLPMLWKSTNGGYAWEDITEAVRDAENLPSGYTFQLFTALAVAPDDEDFVAVAGIDASDPEVVRVVISDDGGDTFYDTHDLTDDSVTPPSTMGYVTCMAISPEVDDVINIAVGGVGGDVEGKIYRLEIDLDGILAPYWRDTTIGLESKFTITGAVSSTFFASWDESFIDGSSVAIPGEGININITNAPAVFPEEFTVDYIDGVGTAQSKTLHVLPEFPAPPPPGYVWDGGPPTITDITGIQGQAMGKYPGWFDCSWVTSLAFSPNWEDDGTILAMCFTYFDAFYLQTAEWTSGYGHWNEEAAYPPAIEIKDGTKTIMPTIPFTTHSALTGIALPSDYLGYDPDLRVVYVYVNGCDSPIPELDFSNCGGYLFRIDDDQLSDGCGPPGECFFSSIAYHGTIESGKALVGRWSTECTICDPEPAVCCEGLEVYRAEDLDCCCPQWFASCKPPSGQIIARVAFSPDGSKAYAVTQGGSIECPGPLCYSSTDESAFSVSIDDGFSWNQIGLIDTDIDFISDVAVCPDCDTAYISTINNMECWLYEDGCTKGICQSCECDSVWRSWSNGNGNIGVWERVYYGDLSDTPSGEPPYYDPANQDPILLRLPCDEIEQCCTIYAGDYDSDNLYYSTDCGQCWTKTPGTKIQIQDIAVETEDTVYILDSDGNVSKSTDYGRRWSDEVDTEVGSGHTIASCCLDDMVVVGGSDGGEVAFSEDGGESWTLTDELPDDASGEVHVICDHICPGTIYAAVSGVGIYRTTTDTGSWDDLNAEPYDYYGIVLGRSDGTLYAPFAFANLGCESGVARNLDPCETACCGEEDWDYLTAGLADDECFNTEPSALRICGCTSPTTNSILWAIDNEHYDVYEGADGTLWIYEDCLAKTAPELLSPICGADIEAEDCAGCTNKDINLCWEYLCVTCNYDIEVATDEDFNQIVNSQIEASGGADMDNYSPPDCDDPCYLIPNGALSAATTYYWHVRASESDTGDLAKSLWSDTCTFNIGAGAGAGVQLLAPENSKRGVQISNVGFSWSSVGGATSYSFVLSPEIDLYGALESTELPGTALTYQGTLDYNTPYFWQVTAWKDGSILSTSDIGTFTTAAEPPPSPPPTTPEPAEKVVLPTAHQITPNWIYAIIAIGATVAVLAIILILRTRRRY